MTTLIRFLPCLLTVALAASMAGCQNPIESQGGTTQAIANDCRSPNALTSQRGCRPATRIMGGL